ncbi:hypothetical protein JWG44_20130 [Leptospira sp. 201903071]|uniref:hypothetical protein n=1 Tax=Leptospira ainazelensis TaxID=2810034 RepID=UPI0019661F82|nr:hypothetical protein [Leptospira ainazelensis]MBM9502566.1 hypothetical protein [Leptospira ainazelensis]
MNDKRFPRGKYLIGVWIQDNSGIHNDINAERVLLLTEKYLVKIKTGKSGGTHFIKIPSTKDMGKIYLQSKLHGGGPTSLKFLTDGQAKKKYKS